MEGVSVLQTDLLTSEATLNVVHPTRSIRVVVAVDSDTFELGVEVHVDVDRGPLVCITEVGLEASTWSLDDDLTTAPMGDHGVPQTLVRVVGDRVTGSVSLGELGEG